MICAMCGKWSAFLPANRCKKCTDWYLSEIGTDAIPKPIRDCHLVLNFDEWASLKKKEGSLRAQGKTDEEVKEEIGQWAKIRAEGYINGQKMLALEKEAERIREEQRRNPIRY